MGTSRRTILTILSIILPAATLTAVSAQASTRLHPHHARVAMTSKLSHHTKTAALRTHVKTPAS